MNIEVLLTEAEIAQEFVESMEARDLPEKFFYWFPLSVRAWREVSKDEAHENLSLAWGGLGRSMPEQMAHFSGTVPIVSFGAGDGAKDRLIIQALRTDKREIKYFPVDASQALLESACADAEGDDVDVLGIKADISSPVHLVLASDASESPKLFLMSGNTLGGFDPFEQIKNVAQCMHEGDRLIIDGETFSEHALADSEQPSMRKFAFAPLASVGVAEDDGQLRFEQKRDERHEGLHLITKRFHAHRDLRIAVSGQEIALARGERIFMNFRYCFTPEAFRWLLTEHGKLNVLQESVSPDGRFVAAICSK